jgi:uncharacterized protein
VSLDPQQEKIVLEILGKYDFDWKVFGSRVCGNPRADSDLDICLINADKPVPLDLLGNLREQFMLSDLPFKVDLVDYQDLSAAFRELIDSKGVRLDTDG